MKMNSLLLVLFKHSCGYFRCQILEEKYIFPGLDLAAGQLGEDRLDDQVIEGVLDEDDRDRHFEQVDAPALPFQFQGFRV